MLTVYLFELRKRSKLVSTYVFFAVLFALAFLWMNVAGGAFPGAAASFGNKVHVNAPLALQLTISVLTLLSVTIIASLFARAISQDFELDAHALLFATPVSTRDYFFGRFFGAFTVFAFVALGMVAGAGLGAKMPYLEGQLFGGNRVLAYVLPYVFVTLPNALFLGGIFFAVAAITRKPFASQLTSVMVLLGYFVSQRALRKLEQKTLADMVDPFGTSAIDHLTEYWTVAEKNELLVPLSGTFLYNRLAWLALGVAALAFAYVRFKRTYALAEKTKPVAPTPAQAIPERPQLTLSRTYWPHLPALAWLQMKASIRNRSFLVMLFAGVLFMIAVSRDLSTKWNTSTYPVTYLMLAAVSGSFGAFMLAITTYFGGDLMWRERDVRMDQIVDALPVPTWLLFAQKLLALLGVQLLVSAVIMLGSIAIQASQGYYQLELGLYADRLFFIDLPQYFTIGVLALFVQALVNDKYLGHFIVVAYFVFSQFAGQMGLEHSLYDYASSPQITYSAMNGYGHYGHIINVYRAYWVAAALALAIVSAGIYVRGTDARIKVRRRRVSAFALAPLAIFAALGVYIFYNTNILHTYASSFDAEAQKARYEREYKPFAAMPFPKVQSVDVRVDIFPEERRLRARGELVVKNTASTPVTRFLMATGADATVHALTGAKEEAFDAPLHLHTLSLPLPPGATGLITYDIDYQPHGFRNSNENDALVENGTFFLSTALPVFGYSPSEELEADGKRKKHKLPARDDNFPRPDAPGARDVNIVAQDADFITLHSIVSTSAEQTAIASGRLVKDWREGERHFFEYQVDAKMINIYAFQSARYETRRDKWNNVDLEVNFHKGHDVNVPRMFDGMKAALTYMTQFSPYQHPLVRIVEFPRYADFAMSLPNTVPYSESIGFIARVDPTSDTDIDFPFFVTAHEVSHQWWAHQLVPAYAQGATFISESLAEYTALMVMKHTLGDEQMRRFLKQELNRYLRGRAGEHNRERTLMLVESQGYIHYSKGSLTLYALADVIGEDKLNAAIAGYLRKVAFTGPPYPVATDFVAELEKVAPPGLVEDLFKTITLYENRAIKATATKRSDDKYDVAVTVSTKKLRADGMGKEDEVAMNDVVDVGWEDSKGAVHTEHQTVQSGEHVLSFVAAKKPVKAGIDPLNKLIDRKADDNSVAISER